MPKATSAPPSAPSPRTLQFRSATDGHRVIYHEPVCPDCGSLEITESEVDTGDGITEIALTCGPCGTSWPVACVVDWTSPAPGPVSHG